MSKTVIVVVLCCLTALNIQAQKVIIHTSSKIISTEIVASSNEQLFTVDGNFELNNLLKVVFLKYEEKFESTYEKIAKVTKVEFDGNNFELENGIGTTDFDLKSIPFKDGLITYEIIIEKTEDKKILQNTAAQFIAEFYRSANNVIQLNDIETGILIAKGYFDLNYESRSLFKAITVKVYHTLKIEFRENRYRVTLDNFEVPNDGQAFVIIGKSETIYNSILEYIANPPTKSINYNQKVFDTKVNFFKSLDNYNKIFLASIEKEINNILADDW